MARQTKGRLYKSGKKNVFHLQYYVAGKEFKVTLRDEHGNPITREDLAIIAAERILHPIKATNQAEQLRQIREAVESAEDKAERLQQEAQERQKIEEEYQKNERALLECGWELFMTCPKRPSSCKRYPANDIPRHTTAANYRSYYKRFSEWMVEHYPKIVKLSDVTSEMATAFMDSIRTGGASGTYNKYLQFFNCFYVTLLEAKKLIGTNPFQDLDRAEHQYNSKKPLSVEQIAHLIDSASGELKLLIALGYFTGLRMGDCCTLQWREIDLLRGVIERIPRKTVHTVKDKSQAIVKIGIAPYLYEMLSSIQETQRRVYLLPTFAEKYLSKGDQQITKKIIRHFIACGIEVHRPGTGRKPAVDPQTGETIINKKTGKVKMIGKRAVVDVGFHSLRYSYISHNAEAGTPAAIIQRNAGHSNPAMTEHYTKISDQAAVKYAAVLQLPTAEAVTVLSKREQLKNSIDGLSDEEAEKVLAFIHSLAEKDY